MNIYQFAEENPLDPTLNFTTKEIALGKNASVNLTQVIPGIEYGMHYHRARDEINYAVQGQAIATIRGKDYLVKPGDLIYIPALAVHGFTTLGNETFQAIVVFTPPFDGRDRIFV